MQLTDFQNDFFEECLEGLNLTETGLLSLNEDAYDAETINAIFRAIHSIKGGGGTFGFNHLSEFAHVMETLLDQIRDGSRTITQNSIDLLLESTDCLRELVNATKADDTVDSARVDDLIQRLNALLGQEQDSALKTAATAEPMSTEPDPLHGWAIRFYPHEHLLHTGNEPFRILRELASLGELSVTSDLSRLPDFHALNPESCYIGWQLKLIGDITRADLDDVFAWVEDDCELTIEPLAETQTKDYAVTSTPPAPNQTVSAATARQPNQATANKAKPAINQTASKDSGSIRVSIDKVDALVNLVGELVITQSMLQRLAMALI